MLFCFWFVVYVEYLSEICSRIVVYFLGEDVVFLIYHLISILKSLNNPLQR